MRTKTLLLSALLGALGSVSMNAQSVYSLNAVGYINVTLAPGYNMVTCPLITTNNSIGSLFNNSAGTITGCQVYFFPYSSANTDTAKNVGAGPFDTTNVDGWSLGGTLTLTPGVAAWFANNTSSNQTFTFVGTVPTGPITNVLAANSYSLVGSVVPVSGDIVTNAISELTNYNIGDQVYIYLNPNPNNPGDAPGYTNYTSASGIFSHHGYLGQWTVNGDPTIPTDYQGFFYLNNSPTVTVDWVENYSVSQ